MDIAIADEMEEVSTETRITRHGHKITYEIKVLQHPEKARACGSGAKSSTDRRPVDPPPIVQLRIFDEGSDTTRTDITYRYRANFFMYASLEPAPSAQTGSRGAKDQVNTSVLLCGSPVSGISYLDRPDQAGYFIFPDLSVKHEGRYQLCFTLYEELKDPALEDRVDDPAAPAPLEVVHLRCSIKSNPFLVFSAKKFPGLSESTTLSRCLSDQGCRVRIRRDVRMRRRETKEDKAWGSDDEDAEPARKHHLRLGSPDLKPYEMPEPVSRPQSPAAAPHHDMDARYHHHDYQQQQLANSALHHGYQRHTGPAPSHTYEQAAIPVHYTPYSLQHQPIQSPQQMSGFQQYGFQQPPPPHYGYTGYAPTYGYVAPQPVSAFQPPPNSQLRHDTTQYITSPEDYQTSQHFQQPAHSSATSYGALTDAHLRSEPISQHAMHLSAPAVGHALSASPALDMKSFQPLHGQSASHRSSYDDPSDMNMPATSYAQQQPHFQHFGQTTQSFAPPPPSQYITSMPSVMAGSKRSYAATFDTRHLDQRLQGGARPDTSDRYSSYAYQTGGQDDLSDDEEDYESPMVYRRADGTVMTKSWPGLMAA